MEEPFFLRGGVNRGLQLSAANINIPWMHGGHVIEYRDQ